MYGSIKRPERTVPNMAAMQVQQALLDVIWGLDEQALPGCAASLGDLVRPPTEQCVQQAPLDMLSRTCFHPCTAGVWRIVSALMACLPHLHAHSDPPSGSPPQPSAAAMHSAYMEAGQAGPLCRNCSCSPHALCCNCRASCCGGAPGCAWACSRASLCQSCPTLPVAEQTTLEHCATGELAAANMWHQPRSAAKGPAVSCQCMLRPGCKP